MPDVGPACEVLLADRLLNDLRGDEREALANWIRARQREDGAWCGLDGSADLSLTALGWWARREAGDALDAPGMAEALRIVHELGGAQRASFVVRLWLAMAGVAPWSWLPAVPNELWLLPPTAALSTSRISPWARGLITAYHLLAQARARLHLADASPLLLRAETGTPIPPRLTRAGLAGDLLQTFDRAIKLARKLPRGTLDRRARRAALARLEDDRRAGGGWLSTRPTLYALLALRAQGARSDDSRVRDGLAALRRARGVVELGERSYLAQGLTSAPLAVTVRLRRAAGRAGEEELLALELGDAPRSDPRGGWPLDASKGSPFDLLATCEVVESLRSAERSSLGRSEGRAIREPALRRAAARIAGCQDDDGGFSRFERGESHVPLARLPWRDADQLSMGRPDDAARVTLTAHALRALELAESPAPRAAVDSGLAWLERRFAEGGRSWTVETLAAVARCTALLCPPQRPLRRDLESALRRRQREDGSFGSLVATAHSLVALVELDGVCVQTRRAAQALVDALDRPRAVLESCPLVGGLGLSPLLEDTSAVARECHLALLSYRRAGGCA